MFMVYELFDFHSHILAHMDDGAQSLEMSVAMLKKLYEQGIEMVYATPHFLPQHESADRFLQRRNDAYKALKEYIEKTGEKNLPLIKLGAEIQICRGVSEMDLSSLEYEFSSAFLFELPKEELSRQVVKEIRLVCDKGNHIPVIAHLDRYTWFKKSDIEALCEIPNVVFQFNTDALRTLKGRRLIMKITNSGCGILFGSDAHNTDDRAPSFHLLSAQGGKSPISARTREILMSAHKCTAEYIFNHRFQDNSNLFII